MRRWPPMIPTLIIAAIALTNSVAITAKAASDPVFGTVIFEVPTDLAPGRASMRARLDGQTANGAVIDLLGTADLSERLDGTYGLAVSWTGLVVDGGGVASLQGTAASRASMPEPRLPAGTRLSVSGSAASLSVSITAAAAMAQRALATVNGQVQETSLGCEPVLDLAAGRSMAMTRKVLLAIDRPPREIAPCRPAGSQAIDLIPCAPRLLTDGRAQLYARPSDGQRYLGACTAIGLPIAVTEATTGCDMVHDWERGITIGGIMPTVRTADGATLAVGPCRSRPDGSPSWPHRREQCAALPVPAAYKPKLGMSVLRQEQVVIEGSDGADIVIGACQPPQDIRSAAWQLTTRVCQGKFAHDRTGGWSYGTHQWVLTGADNSDPVPVTECVQDIAQRYPHSVDISSTWIADDSSLTSRRTASLLVDLPGNRMVLEQPYKPLGQVVEYSVIDQQAVMDGSPVRLGCEIWQPMRQRYELARMGATSVTVLGGSAKAAKTGGC